jgi:uncharacterized protein (DUF2126 family)
MRRIPALAALSLPSAVDRADTSPQAFDDAIRDHDAAVRACGVPIWVGAEPTFTDCRSNSLEWINAATGPEKYAKALELLGVLARQMPGAAVLRTVGRQYDGEALPRWSLGLLAARDGRPLWTGPADPVISCQAEGAVDLPAFRARLLETLGHAGFFCAAVDAGGTDVRLIFGEKGTSRASVGAEALSRQSVHARRTPREGLEDELAAKGIYLLVLDAEQPPAGAVARVELPAFGTVEEFGRVLAAVSQAGLDAGLPSLILSGYPPPVDASLSWATITPDPGVIEINASPHATAESFLAGCRALYSAAADCGLTPYRPHFNGDVADSGGAGQITFGGPSPAQSPFFLRPRALPALVRYANRHPCLSYLFAHDHVGSSGQAVRTDETSREHLDGLALAIDLLEHEPAPAPERIWQALAPFLADAHGNAHRAELNIEKLWNPFLPGRGKLGLVEFRSMRMAHSPERTAALVALLRAIVARLGAASYDGPLVDWGRNLHDRFALPFYLAKDLAEVLDDLAANGMGLGDPIRLLLADDNWRVLARIDLPGPSSKPLEGAKLTIKRAIEFWPLVGDAASQESGASRLIDPSTARLELCLRPHRESDRPWRVTIGDRDLPLNPERDAQGLAWVTGLRYRRFVPLAGLHPTLPAQGPIRLLVTTPDAEAVEVTIHEWRPDNEAYDGLPKDLDEAARRRSARVTRRSISCPTTPSSPAPPGAVTRHCVDLRRFACL